MSSPLLVQDLSLAQVKSIHIGGHKGIHAPTLAEFLKYAPAFATQTAQLQSFVGTFMLVRGLL